MDPKEQQANWNELGKRDPFWVILSDPKKRNHKWNVDEFFKTGQVDIIRVMEQAQQLGLPVRRGMALDFGCGAGRLTQPLCQHFSHVIGVDVAPSMIELAKRYNQYGRKCRYIINKATDLKIFEDNSFDFILSLITLQHLEPKFSKQYLKEFIRILAPGGLLVFQIPSELIPQNSVSVTAEGNPLGALPDKAFKAEISPEKPFITAILGSLITLDVKVKNISNVLWPASESSDKGFPINLGNHWYRGEEVLAWDDERVSLQRDLKPKEEVFLTLIANTPQHPGDYILELDMVQDRVAWFHDKGSKTAKVQVCIKEYLEKNPKTLDYAPKVYKEGNATGAKSKISKVASPIKDLFLRITGNRIFSLRTGLNFIPRIEMYGVPKEEVVGLVLDNGGKLVSAKENSTIAPQWNSFIYWVTKNP